MPEQVLFRVDPRFVHATLMNAWVPAVGAGWIMVADADVMNDPRRRTIFEMSAMDAVRLWFVPESKVAERLEQVEEVSPGIVIFASLGSVLRAMRGGLAMRRLNVGHVPAGPGRTEVHPAVHLGSGDQEMIRQLEAQGVEVRIQPLPDDPPVAALGSSPPAPASGNLFAPPPSAPALPAADADDERPDRARALLEVVNERGLHLRAAHVLAALANEISAQVKVGWGDDEMVNAKSLLGLTTLGAARGARLHVVVEGEGAEAALERIRALFALGFHEREEGA
jgi:phosphotransferase system HPr (HPr) family protein